MTNQSLNK